MKKIALIIIIILALVYLVVQAKAIYNKKGLVPAKTGTVTQVGAEKRSAPAQFTAPSEQANQITPSISEAKTGILSAIEFRTGFGWGKLHNKKTYKMIPFIVDFDFDLKKLTKKLNFNPRQLLQFQIEPFISPVISPDANIELGTLFLLKIGILPETSKIQPYLKGGAGMVYITQHTREQGSQFNFIEQLGCGIHYFFKKNTALTIEGSYRHLSNCGIKDPNHGINTCFVTTGVTHKF
ncbi:MAG: acyloxyacyl hydrolase [Candidatus Omnitrophica bacterium]|nr:acyloxyacyl hydrolase [Candidatus Omnitrophota bacterium]